MRIVLGLLYCALHVHLLLSLAMSSFLCHILKSISMKGIDYVKLLKNAINSLFVGKLLEYLCILIPSHYSFS